MLQSSLTEVWAEPGLGKTHQSHDNWPNPLHVDTAYTEMGFRELDKIENQTGHGESWPVVRKLYDNETVAEKHYHYLTEYKHPGDVVNGDYESVIIDNITDLRTLAAAKWADDHDTDWPQQQQWGAVNNMVSRFVQRLKSAGFHVVIISQLDDEYERGEKTGNRKPKCAIDTDYMADFRVEIATDVDNNREILMHKNRHTDMTNFSECPFSMGTDEVSLKSLMQIAGLKYNND